MLHFPTDAVECAGSASQLVACHKGCCMQGTYSPKNACHCSKIIHLRHLGTHWGWREVCDYTGRRDDRGTVQTRGRVGLQRRGTREAGMTRMYTSCAAVGRMQCFMLLHMCPEQVVAC